MSNIYNKAHELVNEIKKSKEYTEYLDLKKKAYSDENNKKMLDDFRKEAVEVQIAQMSGEEVTAEKVEKVKKLEDIIILNPTLKDFMFAELKFSQIIQDINKIIGDGIDLE